MYLVRRYYHSLDVLYHNYSEIYIVMYFGKKIAGFLLMLSVMTIRATAQFSEYDTIRLGSIVEQGVAYPIVFMEECTISGEYMNGEDRVRRNKLRRDIYKVYPYAITATAIMKDLDSATAELDRRRDRRKYLKSVNKQLNETFKEPLKNLSVDQGHVLIKLIARQSGKNCYSIIRELKGGVSAVVWQSVGLMFKNNLRKDYDPEGVDKEMEVMVQMLEESAGYRYQLFLQDEMMKRISTKPVAGKGR